jgi:hypothetical protein
VGRHHYRSSLRRLRHLILMLNQSRLIWHLCRLVILRRHYSCCLYVPLVVHILHFWTSAQAPVATGSMIGPRLTIWLRVFMLHLPQMHRAPTRQQYVPRITLESLSLMAHLLDSPVHELLQLENISGGSLRLLVFCRGNLRKRRLTLSALL